MDRDDPPFPPQRPLEKHARIEADLFCPNCWYNLHSQPVVRDERLGILVVRCTECGRFQPAAVASSAARVWLSRLAAVTLGVWVLAVTAFVVASGFGLGGVQVAHVEIFTTGAHVAPDGQRVYPSWDPTARKRIWVTEDDRTVPIDNPVWRRAPVPMKDIFQDKLAAGLIGALMAAAPVVFGAVMSVIMWHVPRRRYWMLAVLPILAGIVITSVYHIDESSRGGDVRVVAKVVAAAVAEQIGLIAVGTLIGRAVARFFVGLFVPPRPRQALAFLWTADGKTPPFVHDAASPKSS